MVPASAFQYIGVVGVYVATLEGSHLLCGCDFCLCLPVEDSNVLLCLTAYSVIKSLSQRFQPLRAHMRLVNLDFGKKLIQLTNQYG